jgi:hypothetical protein
MKRLLFGILLLAITAINPLLAQLAVQNQLMRAADLNDRGDFREALRIIESLLASPVSAPNDVTGVAWNIRGLALESLGDWEGARRSYENAIVLLEKVPSPIEQYASALDNLGSLKADMGQLDESYSLRNHARQVYQTINDHAGMARISVNFALLALVKKDGKHTRKFLADAAREEALVANPTAGDLAALDNAQAIESAREGHFDQALRAIKQAIDLWTLHYGTHYYILASGLSLRGQIENAMHHHAEAEADLGRSLDILRSNHDLDSRVYFMAEAAYAKVLRDAGEHEEADRFATDADRGLAALRNKECNRCSVSAESFR